jgi:hypothetical protein
MKASTFFLAATMLSIPYTAHAACLQEAGDFAERICGQVKAIGKSTLVTVNGDLTAEAKGLIAKAFGQLGAGVEGKVETKTFENVLQEQLAPELVNVRECGIKMAKAAMDQVCTKTIVWKTCPNQAFGLARWENEETLHGTSGWRGGGYNQGAYCTEFINTTIQGRGLGGAPHFVDEIKSSEETTRTGFMNAGPVKYNYHCTIKLHWNPTYNQKADPLCGPE